MANTVLVGLQWGDEGKGKIIDVLTAKSDVVVRFQGGNNAGHTVEIGKDKFILHLIPSGILRPEALCVIGNGVVLNPIALNDEIEELAGKGIDITGRLAISTRCPLLFRYHCVLDSLQEGKADRKIGTTGRGIGPAYADKVSRTAIRAEALLDMAGLKASFFKLADRFNAIFRAHGAPELDAETEWAQLEPVARKLAPMVKDTVLLLNRAAADGKEILFEGAQGTWLDIDYGTYPFVTSSNTTSGAACTGAGVPPRLIDRVVGVLKAYTTRVGEGPFPTELPDKTGEFLRTKGGEFGATTGRPRRCGWFDAVATRYSVMLNGVDGVALTKMDVLDEFETLRICTAYDVDGKVTSDMPTDSAVLSRVKPIYEEIDGWCCDTSGVSSYADLPEKAKAYIARLMELIGTRTDIVSVGPRRDQTFPADA